MRTSACALLSTDIATEGDACMQRSWNLPSHERFDPPAGCGNINSISSLEATAAHSMRTLQRFVGQCNIVTHIKEATFVGPDDHIVACGSDHGNVFLFDSLTGELLRVLSADQEVANCVQCHPTLPVLATSGLEYVVRFDQTVAAHLLDAAGIEWCSCAHACTELATIAGLM
jgi:WD40 repeat protein